MLTCNFFKNLQKYKRRQKIILFVVFFLFQAFVILNLPFANEALASPYQNIVNQANQKSLGIHNQWLALGHYKKTGNNSYYSYINSLKFFLSKKGKFSPQEELEATIKNFLSDQESICRYPARFNFLDKEIEISKYLKKPECLEFKEWYEIINPQGVTLVFPASFINNPASAFGHTLIRLDEAPDNENASLYSYSVNFSAETFGEPGLLYAFKGVFGGYAGKFSVAPYYELVKKYSDLERRDIWEYNLNFSKDEIKILVEHLWELRDIHFSYYYFDENCSYHLLGLFDVAKPNNNLRESFKLWVIPSDTLKEVVGEKGIIKKEVFRPSIVSKFEARIKHTPSNLAEIAKKIVKMRQIEIEDYKVLDINQKAQVLDLSYDYLEYLVLQDKITKDISDKLALKLLNARSRLKILLEKIIATPKGNPLETHPSKLLGVSAGNLDDKNYYELNIRPAYHGLLDPDKGYIQGQTINFLDLSFRQIENQDFKLNELNILDINSFSLKNSFLKPISWKLYTGLNRQDSPNKKQDLIYQNKLLFGTSSKITDNSLTSILLGINSKLNTHFEDNNATGASFNFNHLFNLNDNFRFNSKIEVSRFLLGEMHSSVNFSNELRIKIEKNLDLSISFSRVKDIKDYYNDYNLGLKLFF